jgi:hypothetical protein
MVSGTQWAAELLSLATAFQCACGLPLTLIAGLVGARLAYVQLCSLSPADNLCHTLEPERRFAQGRGAG